MAGFAFRFSGSQQDDTAVSPALLSVNSTLAGNCLVVFLQSQTGVTVTTVTDNQGGSNSNGKWYIGPSISGNQYVVALVQSNCPAGVTQVTITFSSTAYYVQGDYLEIYGISTAASNSVIDNSHGATFQSTPAAAGSFTTTTDGAFVIQYATLDSAGPPILVDHVVKGSGYSLALANLQPNGSPSITQYTTQSSHGAINPSLSWSLISGSAVTADTLAIALKTSAGAGTQPIGARVACIQKSIFGHSGNTNNTQRLQFPHEGNLIHAYINNMPLGSGSPVLSSVTDSDSNSYDITHTYINTNQFTTYAPFAKNVNPNLDLYALQFAFTDNPESVSARGFITLYDIVGVDANPLVQVVTTAGNQTSTGNLTANTITPQYTGSVIPMITNIYSHAVSGLVAPTAANGGVWPSWNYSGNDGGGTGFEDDDFSGFWLNGSTLSSTNIVLSIQNNTAGAQWWTSMAIEYKAAPVVYTFAGMAQSWMD